MLKLIYAYLMVLAKTAICIPKETNLKFEDKRYCGKLANSIVFPVKGIQDGEYIIIFNIRRRSTCTFIEASSFNQEEANRKKYSYPVAYVQIAKGKIVAKHIYKHTEYKLREDLL